MKKIFISLFAVAALAACTKSEVNYDGDSQIGFAPVAKKITKSVAGVEDNTYPTSLPLYVFANTQGEDANGNLTSNWPATYFTNAEFVYNRLTTNNVFEGSTPRYWPNVKSLVFAGYSDACGIDKTTPRMDFSTNTLTIPSYTQNNSTTYASVGANDLMWFAWDGNAYTKQSSAVTVQMQHACSWITVQVIGDETTGNNYLLKNLTINGLYHTGEAKCMATTTANADGTTSTTYNASWGSDEKPLTNQSIEVLYSSTTGETFPKSTTSGAEPKVFETVANNMVVIPQLPTSIDVTYSYVPQEGVPAVTEVVKGLSLKLNEANTAKWQSGVHYIYTITITATEILIDPKVVGWDPEVVTPGVSI